MNRLSCDILVAGGGPAGSSAARVAAQRGLKVMLAERRPVIGVPVRCAEYIPAPLVGALALGNGYVVQELRGMRTLLPDGDVRETRAPGFTIHRDRFDQTLARAAETAGADVLPGLRVIARHESRVYLKDGTGRETAIEAKVIIGADGPHSTVGKWIGSVNQNLLPAVQVTVPLREAMEYTEVYFHPEIFGGYGWLFPKGDQANVGLGIRRRGINREKIGHLLDRLLGRLASEDRIEFRPTRYVAGWIPVEPVRTVTGDNILLAGDAAGHTHPITGAGVCQAVMCGRMAGKWAARAVLEDNLGLLQAYEAEWRDLFEETLQRAYQRRRFLEENWHRFDDVIRRCWVAYKAYYAAP